MTFTLTTEELKDLLAMAIHNYEDAMTEDDMDTDTAMEIAVDTAIDMLRERNEG